MIVGFYMMCMAILFFMLYASPSFTMLTKHSQKPYQRINSSSKSNDNRYSSGIRSSTVFNVSLPTDPDYARKSTKVAKSSLYINSELIMELIGSEVRSLLSNITRHYPVVIVYYASWCGHCQHFVRTYEKIATEIILNKKIPLILGALDCVNYHDECWEAGIRQYPSAIAYNVLSGKSYI